MSQSDWLFIFAAGQFAIDLLLFFGFDMKAIKSAFPNLPQARQSRLILALLIGGLLSSGYGWSRSSRFYPDEWHSAKQETIYAKRFVNETVELDGKIFDHCHFENVKLLYHGRGPVSFNQSDFKGQVWFGSDNIAIRNFMIVGAELDKLSSLRRLYNWVEMDKNGNPLSTR